MSLVSDWITAGGKKWRGRPEKSIAGESLTYAPGLEIWPLSFRRYWKGKAQIDGLDFSGELINVGRRKVEAAKLQNVITFREGNAENLPYENVQYDAVTITFGLRNINDRLKALKEFYRVTKPGGCFVCLEFSRPLNPVFSRIYFFYLMRVAPFISRLLGSDPAAYRISWKHDKGVSAAKRTC